MNLYDKITSWFKQIFGGDTPQVLVKLLVDDKKLIPTKAHFGDSGFDLRSSEQEVSVIKPGETKSISCGFAMELPMGYEAQVRPRSGLALKHSITVLNTPGTIDYGYRGEVKVILSNFGKNDFKVRYGDRIAQMVIMHVPRISIVNTDKLSDTARGQDGFGSTGIK